MALKTVMWRGPLLVAIFLVGCTRSNAPAARGASGVTPSARAGPSEAEAVTRPDATRTLTASRASVTIEPAPVPSPSTRPTPRASTSSVAGSGRVSATGTMAVARASHTATLLGDGRVLIAGGCTLAGCEMGDDGATAEIYDPEQHAFLPTGGMTTERVGHSATVLATGKVLLAGGFDQTRVLASAELYDLATGAFAMTASMSAPRAGYSATLLPSGKVLMVGGFDGSRRLASAELYDPATGAFTVTGELATARAEHVAASLPDGRVLVTGGSSGGDNVLASAEIYDPTLGTFQRTGDMTLARYKHAAITLRDGRVLIVGGSDARDGRGRYTSTELYDPATRAFQRGPELAAARYKLFDAVTRLTSGEILVGGGDERVEVYDPTMGTFRTTAGDVGVGRAFATTTLLADGRVVIVGGYDASITPTAEAWVYDPLG